jgi:PHP family Zn ribbon phosphoesterase
VVKGVLDRIVEIQDFDAPRPPEHRPAYQYQVPLQFVPKIGPVSLNKLLNRFGNEMTVLHAADFEEIRAVVGTDLARKIVAARAGELPLLPGGGGRYGRAVSDAAETQLDLGMVLS